MPQLRPNSEFSSAKCIAILSRTQVGLQGRFEELLPQVLPGASIVCPDNLEQMRKLLVEGQSEYELVVVIGGDGTLNRVLQHIDPKRQVLAVLPSGTGNDFASALGYPSGLERRLDYLSSLSAKPTDYGMIAEVRFINSAGFGIDTETLEERERRSGPIRNNYNLLFLLALSRMRCSTVKVSSGEFSETGRYYWILGMNSDRIGGGTRIAPEAMVDDGLLDMVLVRETSKLAMIRLMPAAIKGKHTDSSMVEYRKVPSFAVESEDVIPVIAADGECYQHGRHELTISCVPSGIRLLR